MTTYASAFFIMQVQYMDFRATMVGWASVATFFLLAALVDEARFSVLGQPTEGLLAVGSCGVGIIMGREVQKMLRSHFAVHIVLQRTRHERERERERERNAIDVDLDEGRYLQLGLIGRGAAADVFLARRTSPSVPHPRGSTALCAVKRIKKSSSHKLEMRMLDEFTILQALSHPFLVELHHAFQVCTSYLVLPTSYLVLPTLYFLLTRSWSSCLTPSRASAPFTL